MNYLENIIMKEQNKHLFLNIPDDVLSLIFRLIGDKSNEQKFAQYCFARIHPIFFHFYKNEKIDKILCLNEVCFIKSIRYWENIEKWNATILYLDDKNIIQILSYKNYLPKSLKLIKKLILSKNIKKFKHLIPLMHLFSYVEEIDFEYDYKIVEVEVKKMKKRLPEADPFLDNVLEENNSFIPKKKELIWYGLECPISVLPKSIKIIRLNMHYPFIVQTTLLIHSKFPKLIIEHF